MKLKRLDMIVGMIGLFCLVNMLLVGIRIASDTASELELTTTQYHNIQIELNAVQDDLSDAYKRNRELRIQNNELLNELDRLEQQIEDMSLEIDTITLEYEQYRQEVERLNWYRDIFLEEQYQEFLYDMCQKYGVDYDIQLAKIKVESEYKTNAINKSNDNGSVDYGLSQINSIHLKTAEDLGFDVINNVYHNIEYGVMVYADIYNKVVSRGYSGREATIRSLNSYNRGWNGYQTYIANGNRYDSWYYANKVLKNVEK